ncbi:MAG: VWA domain-containing protein [Opitutae bacterium]|nr:VWA domain-containing protein [Opitutae bacterium]MBT5716451.1 VWA domain-containing protein [Opitutae bacterium]
MNLFANQNILLIGLSTIIGLFAVFYWSQKIKQNRLQLLTSFQLLPKLTPNLSFKQQILKLCLFVLGITFLFLGLARPQWGSERRRAQPSGIDILIALDVSKSMLARDVRPNRLERVKLSISNLLDRVEGDRLGLIAFSGSAFLQCPLTLDHQAFTKTLNDLQIGIIKQPGTDISRPIEEAIHSFSKDDTDRFLILLSDGEDLEGKGLKQAKEAAKDGVKIYTIGIGAKEGSRIPMDSLGQPARNFLRDPQGQTVITKLDESSLRAIADATQGKYFSLGPTGEGLAKVLGILQSIGQQKKREQLSTKLPIDRYSFFVFVGFLFLCLEMLTSKLSKTLSHSVSVCTIFLLFYFSGCLKQDNVKRAEEALESGNPAQAAEFFKAEINATISIGNPTDPRLFLNAGLADLQAGNLQNAEESLEVSLDANLDDPAIQAKALNGLGNIYYIRANKFLDERNIAEARKAWEQSIKYYESSSLIDGNVKAKQNLESLNKQIQERINALICKISGKIWRDINGDGKPQEVEPDLQGYVYWDKDENGEHNKTSEPIIQSNDQGIFSFEWISDKYPTSIRLGTKLAESNQSQNSFLLPMLPPPPPPENPSFVKNYYLDLNKPGEKVIGMPYRAAPIIKGQVWKDENGNGSKDPEDKQYVSAKLYLDQNGNFQYDQNETAFEPAEDGSFAQPVPPGQYSVCIQPQNPDANITFPIEENKAYLVWTDFESKSENLDFGIQDNNQQDQNSSSQQNQPQPNPPEDQEDNENAEPQPLPEEINALYERLLQEMESKSEPLEQEVEAVQSITSGRDY